MSSIRKIKHRHQLFNQEFTERRLAMYRNQASYLFSIEDFLAPACALIQNPTIYHEFAPKINHILAKHFPEWNIQTGDTLYFNSLEAIVGLFNSDESCEGHSHYFPYVYELINIFYCHNIESITLNKPMNYRVSLKDNYEIFIYVPIDSQQDIKNSYKIEDNLMNRIRGALNEVGKQFIRYSPQLLMDNVKKSVKAYLLVSKLIKLQHEAFQEESNDGEFVVYKEHVDFLMQQPITKELVSLLY